MTVGAPRWRLIVDEAPGDGAWNMAVDRAIQVARSIGEVPPTLRLYSWSRPTVTLGRFQDPSGVDRRACLKHGVDVVRRFTGGRGVLHDDELTYAVIASVDDGVPRGTAASYRHLCQALVESYLRFGLGDASLTKRSRGGPGSDACYLHATPADLSLDARKLSGSAQVWLADTVLQHGSFVISRDVAREGEVFSLEPEACRALAETTITIAEVLGYRPEAGSLVAQVAAAFSSVLQVELIEGSLTLSEIDTAKDLLPDVGVGIDRAKP